MEAIRSDIFGFAETKLHCRDTKVQSMLHKQKKKVWSHCKMATGSSDVPWHSFSKPGGVLLGVTGPSEESETQFRMNWEDGLDLNYLVVMAEN